MTEEHLRVKFAQFMTFFNTNITLSDMSLLCHLDITKTTQPVINMK